ncbi:MAG: diacylglycerol kinase family protein [bacterium]|nr:diacylglycerol kinase family protein [bacterium]
MYQYLKKKHQSFRHTFTGLRIAWQEEPNFRFQLVFGTLTIILAFILHISEIEFLIVLSMVGLVLTAELFNTALEELCDKFQPTHDPHIAKIKDLAAAAVFVSALFAFIVGIIIFLPHVIVLL